jgi:mannose-6-phosphate isomerase-like protein (cupin superfamily)
MAPSHTPVTYVPKDKVSALFAGKGGPLFAAENYKVMAAHRDKVEKAEVHTLDTDLFYIVDGAATIVTGGELVDAAPTDPNEIRGISVKGGDSRKLEKGDVLIIPRGVPHWINQVTPSLIYFVVKVR